MACSKYTLTNTGSTLVNFNYRRCDDSLWEYQVELNPNQTKNIWLIDNTYSIASSFRPFVVLVNQGVFPSISASQTPTPTMTPTPTNTSTPTQTPTQSSTQTQTPTQSSTQTPTPTPTETPAITIPCTLGRANNFAVLANTTITNTGNSVVTGDLGLFPGTTVTGFNPDGTVTGNIEIDNLTAANAQIDAEAAFTCFNNLTPTDSVVADIGGYSLISGIYQASSSLAITGDLTLNGLGDPNSIFVFLVPSTFIPATDASVVLVNGAQACNVYWIVGTSATLGTNSITNGTIIARTAITFNTNASLNGRAIALDAAITLIDNNITNDCYINPTSTPTPTQTSTPTQTPTQTSTQTPTPTNTETSTPTPTQTSTQTPTPTNTETSTPTPTPTNSETPTQTPTNSETPTQTPTSSETPTNTPTQTPTPTGNRFAFTVYSGSTSDEACGQYYSTITIYGESQLFDDNSVFFDTINGPSIGDLTGYFNNLQTIVQLSSGLETGGFGLCQTLTPTPSPTVTPTHTPTQTPTQTGTPTSTPTPTATFSYYTYSLGTGATETEACINFTNSPVTIYGTVSGGIGPNLGEFLYETAGIPLTDAAPNGYYSNGTAWYQVTGGLGQITSSDPNGCI